MTRPSTSDMRQTITEFFERAELDVTCRRRNHGYSLYWEDGQPLARLKETGRGDLVEVLYWNDRADRWKPIGEFGLELPLQEALEYIDDDSGNLFFEQDAFSEHGFWDDSNPMSAIASGAFRAAVLELHWSLMRVVTFGAGFGALFQSRYAGLVGGALACLLAFAYFAIRSPKSSRVFPIILVVPAIVCMLVGGVTGAIGACVNDVLGGGLWGVCVGIMVAVGLVLLMTKGKFSATVTGWVAGVLWIEPQIAYFGTGFWALLIATGFVLGLSTLLGNVIGAYTQVVRQALKKLHDERQHAAV